MKPPHVPPPSRQFGRRIAGRAQEDHVIDTYKLHGKLHDPTVCPQCGAVYHKGRWQWTERPATAEEALCPACHRIADAYPAGVLSITGAFVPAHRTEIETLARNQEAAEKGEHPLNRIIAIAQAAGAMQITTTDVHLPRRIGEALRRAFHGDLKVHYDEHNYFARVDWHRDE
jgi:hypothetical protein